MADVSLTEHIVGRPDPAQPGRAALLAGIALYALFTAAEFTGFGPLALGDLRVPICLGLAFGPLALYLLLKHPLIFPFGAYLFTMPIDVILRNSSGATASRIVAIAAAGVLGLHILARREVRMPGRAWFAWLAFVVWAGLSLAWSINPTGSLAMFGTILQLFLMFTVLTLYPVSRADLKAVMALVVGSGIFAAVYGLVGFYGGRVAGWNYSRLTLRTEGGLYVDPNDFATSFVLPIALAMAALTNSRNAAVKIVAGSSIVLMIVGILLTGSRGGLIASMLVLVYYIVRARQRILTLALGGAALGLSALFPAVWIRFATDDGAQGSGTGRTFIWATGLLNFWDHFVGGSGIGTYGDVYDRNFFSVYQKVFQGWNRPGHSIIVNSLVEVGVVGLLLILTAWFMMFRELRSVSAQSSFYPMRIALEGALLGLFYESLTIDTLYLKFYWLAFSLVLMVAGAARKEQSEALVDAGALIPADYAAPRAMAGTA
jgi:hypothetical protein